ncbi:MAG: pilus assembly protein CpaD, partial [Bauldia sp.]|nr:pilus assembly protein CpaD [Bauldia sp.]
MTTVQLPSSDARGRRVRYRHFAIAAGMFLALSGCKTTEEPIIVGSVPDDYRTNHPIAINESVET